MLRRASIEDAGELFASYTADPEVVRYMPWEAHGDIETTREFLRRQVKEWDAGSGYSWTVRLRDGGRVAGMVSASGVGSHRATFGYVFARDTWGQGLATEAANAVVDVLLQIGELVRVWATCDIDNAASARVLEKVGFVREGTIHRWDKHNVSAEPRDCWLYASGGATMASGSLPHHPLEVIE